MRKVLAIETSCDETSVSVVSNVGDTYKIHSNIITYYLSTKYVE